MAANSSGLSRVPLTARVAVSSCSTLPGVLPKAPAGTCTFWARIALLTSSIDRPYPTSFCGSIHTRMAASEAKNCSLPTPATRRISLLMLRAA